VILRDAQNDVALGISRVQKLLTFEKLTIDPRQKNALREFGLYEYDKKSIERGLEKPVKTDDHCMDALRYMVMGLWSKVRHYLPVQEKEDSEDHEHI
jgi:phage terminase large subunit